MARNQAAVATPEPGLITFRSLFDDHYPFVWRTLLHFGLSPTNADDAAQDVFLVVYRRLQDFDGRTHPRGWLFGIARRVALSHHRGERRALRRLDHEEVGEVEKQCDDNPEAALERKEAEEFMVDFLNELPPAQRDTFFLAELEGCTVPEIAEAMGVGLNTAYSRLRLAREKFSRTVDRRKQRLDRESKQGRSLP